MRREEREESCWTGVTSAYLHEGHSVQGLCSWTTQVCVVGGLGVRLAGTASSFPGGLGGRLCGIFNLLMV